MKLRALYILGCLLLFCGACGEDSGAAGSEFELIEPVNLDEPDAADVGVSDTQSPDDILESDASADSEDATNPDSGPSGAAIGEACAQDADCRLGRCLGADAFLDGYCSTPDPCEFDDHCPEDTTCFAKAEAGAEDAFCGARCEQNSECRDGYSCQQSAMSPFKACAPQAPDVPAAPDARLDGAACESDSDCENAYCLRSPEWPDGYCTTVDCLTYVDCARGEGENEVDNRCLVQQGATNFCVRMCQSSRDCRDNYICAGIGGGQGFCSPDPQAEYSIADIDAYPFDITCGLAAENSRVYIGYEVAADTTSYMLTPLSLDGRDLRPRSTLLPGMSQINYSGANAFQTVPSQIFGVINPILTPVLERFEADLQAGVHSLEIATQSQNICHYLLEESTPGTSIDFNIYLVGMGLTAEAAETDPDMQAVLAQFDAIYEQLGVSIGEVRFQEITGDDAAAYQIVRSDFELQELVALSTLPDGGYDGALSANIFFVRAVQIGGGAIGISQGLPGPAGLHGTPSSGVVFTSEYIGEHFRGEGGAFVNGNAFTGIVMAHEVGHYLGLFHTSEQYGQGFDPVEDTPRCTNPSAFPDGCPDLHNLMFPLAGITHTELSEGQKYTLIANPLTKD